MGSDRGIRVNGKHKFVELMPQRKAMGDTAFRAAVIAYMIEEFGTTLAGAATQYNEIKKWAQKEWKDELADLGRPADKNNGGRKKKVAAVFVDAEAFVPTFFNVYNKKTGRFEKDFSTLEDANMFIRKGKDIDGKFAKLYWK